MLAEFKVIAKSSAIREDQGWPGFGMDWNVGSCCIFGNAGSGTEIFVADLSKGDLSLSWWVRPIA